MTAPVVMPRQPREVEAMDVWQAAYVIRTLVGIATNAAANGSRVDLGSALAATFSEVERKAQLGHRETMAERVQRWADEWV